MKLISFSRFEQESIDVKSIKSSGFDLIIETADGQKLKIEDGLPDLVVGKGAVRMSDGTSVDYKNLLETIIQESPDMSNLDIGFVGEEDSNASNESDGTGVKEGVIESLKTSLRQLIGEEDSEQLEDMEEMSEEEIRAALAKALENAKRVAELEAMLEEKEAEESEEAEEAEEAESVEEVTEQVEPSESAETSNKHVEDMKNELTVEEVELNENTSKKSGDYDQEPNKNTGSSNKSGDYDQEGEPVEEETYEFTVGLSSDTDSGSKGDFITNAGEPVFKGTGTPSTIVTVTINGADYSTTVDSEGGWVLPPIPELEEGEYPYTASDSAGNKVSGVLIIDQTNTLTHDLQNDTGVSDSDEITQDSRLVYVGKTDPGSKVTITIAGKEYSTTANADGDYTLAVTDDLPDGVYDYSIKTEDVAGNIVVNKGTVVIDTKIDATVALSSEQDTGSSDSDGITKENTNLTLAGILEEGATATLTFNGVKYPVQVQADGSWSVTITGTLPDGDYDYALDVSDVAGNVETITGAVKVDTETHVTGGLDAISDTGFLDNDGLTQDNKPVFSGHGEPNSEVTVEIGGNSYTTTVLSNGEWQLMVNNVLPDGVHDYEIVIVDIAGNTESVEGSIEVDTFTEVDADLVTDSGRDDSDNITNVKNNTIEGQAEAGSTGTIVFQGLNGGKPIPLAINPDGSFSFETGELEDGTYQFTITTVDQAGNEDSFTDSITVDTVTFIAGGLDSNSDSGSDDSDNITKDNTPTFSGSGEPNSLITLTINGNSYTGTVNESGGWSIDVTDSIPDGAWDYELVAVDVAGNKATESGKITVDTTAPSGATVALENDSGADESDWVTKNGQLELSGTAEVGAEVRVKIDGVTYTVDKGLTVNPDGTWALVLPEPLSDGDYLIEIEVVDAAGNVEELEQSITVDTETFITGGLSEESDSGSRNDDDVTNNNTPKYSGTAEPNSEVVLTINGSSYSTRSNPDGSWEIDVSDALPDGEYDVTMKVIDTAGNEATVSSTITIDTVAPIQSSLELKNDTGESGKDFITKDNVPQLSGKADVGTDIKIIIELENGELYEYKEPDVVIDKSTGEWSFASPIQLPDGKHQIVVVSTDVAGNESEKLQDLVVDTTIELTSQLDSSSDSGVKGDKITNITTPTFKGTGVEGDKVTLNINGNSYTTTVGSDGTWSIRVDDALPHNPSTPYEYEVVVVDTAGNTTSKSDTITIDTETDVTGGLDVSSDSALLDGITSDSTPKFTGQAEVGANVTLTIDGKTYDAIVDPLGRWTVDIPTALSDGEYSYEITSTDIAGNIDVHVDKIVIDTINSVSGGLDANSDSAANDGITNINTPKFSGHGEAGATITVSIGGKEYQGAVSPDGKWEVNITDPLPDGVHSYQITSVDVAGNEATIPSGQITVDTVTFVTGGLAPGQDTGRDSEDQLTNISSPTFGGTGEEGSLVTLTIDGKNYSTAVTNGVWTISGLSKLSDGEHDYTIQITDVAGNTSTIKGNVTVDTKPPEFTDATLVNDTGSSNSDMITKDGNIAFQGQVEDDDVEIQLSINGAVYSSPKDITVNPDGTWVFALPSPLPENQNGYNFTITYTDMAGNSVDQTGAVVVDQTNSIVGGLDSSSDSGQVGDNLTNDTKPKFSGQTEAGASVTLEVNGKTYSTTARQDGSWEIDVADNLPDGDHEYVLTSVDKAGNESEIKGVVEVDTTPSSLSSIELSNDSGVAGDWVTNNNIPVWSGRIEENSELTITVRGNGSAVTLRSPDDFVVNPDGTFTATLPASLSDGDYKVEFHAVDAAGNESWSEQELVIDTDVSIDGGLDASSDSGRDNQDNITSDNTPKFSGTGEANSTIKITIDGVAHTTSVNPDGTWEFTLTSPLQDGVYPVTIEIADLAGNTASVDPFDLTIDTTDPSIDHVTMVSDTGDDTTDGLTKESNPTFEGKVESGSSVELKIGGKTYVIPDGSINQDGEWSFTVPDTLMDGVYKWEAVAVDAAGNDSVEKGTIEIDTVNSITGGLSSGSDSGRDTSDGVTNVTTPTFSGKTDPNSKVTINFGNGDSYTASANSQGAWSIDVTTPLPEGVNSYEIVSVDEAGNEARISGDITVDTTIPTGTIELVSDTGESSNDGITRSKNPVFSGTSEAGSEVEIVIDNMTYGEPAVKVNPDGTWTFVTPLELADGDYAVEIRVTDAAGNTFTDQIDITIDNAIFITGGLLSSSDTGSDQTDGITSDNTPSFGGSAEDGAKVTLKIDGKTYTETVSGGSWQIGVPVPLSDGTYNYELVVTDKAGNKQTLTDTVVIDTATDVTGGLDDSSDTGKSNQDNITKDNQPTFSGSAEVGSVVTVTIAGQSQSVTVGGNGSWSMVWGAVLNDGNHAVEIRAVDVAGNDDVVVETITIDTTAPTATIVNLDNDSGVKGDNMTNSARPEFSGQIGADETISFKIDGRTYSSPDDIALNPDGSWEFKVPVTLSDGTYNYEVKVEDEAGNVTSTQGTVIVDTSFSMTGGLDADSDSGSVGDGVTNDTSPKFKGTADAGANITITINGVSYDVLASKTGEWEFTVPVTLADGEYNYSIYGEDAAGNNDTVLGTVVIDTTTEVTGGLDASTDTGVSGDSITNSDYLKFSGNAEEGSSVILTINGKDYPATVDKTGAWSVTLPDVLPEGDYSYIIVTTDIAGNSDTETGSVTVDRTNFITAGMKSTSDSGIDTSDGITNDKKPTFEGATQPNSIVTLTINGSVTYTVQTKPDGTWEFTFPMDLSDGVYTYDFVSVDVAGNEVTESGTFEIDTVAILSGGLDSSTDSGVKSDDLTNNKTPKFSGKGEPDASIEIEINGKVYTASVDTNGDWELVIPAGDELADGTYSYTIKTVDVAGNENTLNKVLEIDTTISVTATMDTDSGLDNRDGVTNIDTPSFSGTMDFGDTITVKIGSKVYSQPDVIVNSDGTWEFTVPQADALSDGSYVWEVRVEDAAGNVDAVGDTIVVDTTAPTALTAELLNGSVPDQSISNENTPSFGGNSEIGTSIDIKMNGVPVPSSAITVNPDGTWEFTVPNSLSDGDYSFEFTSTDSAGNSQTIAHALTIDTETTLSGGLDNSSDSGVKGDDLTNSNNIKYSGQGEYGATVEVTIDGVTYTTTVQKNGVWTVDITNSLSEGSHLVEIVTTDLAGNSITENQTLEIDRTNVVTVSMKAESDTGFDDNDGYTSDTQPIFSGTTQPNSTVSLSIQGGSTYDVTVNPDGSFEFQIPSELHDGKYTYIFTSTDEAGNIATDTGEFTVDTTTNVVGGLDSSSDTGVVGDKQTKETTPTFSGTGEPNANVEIDINGVKHSVVTDQYGVWSYTIPLGDALPDGTHNYSITITDRAGNQEVIDDVIHVDSSTFVTGELTTDTGFNPTDGCTSDSTPSFGGTLEAGTEITFAINNKTYDASSGVVVNADGTWEFTIPADDLLVDGTYNWSVTVEDAAGNTHTESGTVVVDTATPNQLTVALQNGSVSDDEITNEPKPIFGGSSEAGTFITVKVDGFLQPQSTVTVNPDGTWSFEAPTDLADGDYVFEFISTDAAGNEESITHNLTIDTSTHVSGGLDASCDTGSSGSDGVTNSKNIVFSGTGEVGASITLTIDGQTLTATVLPDGTWSIPVGELDGSSNNVYNYTIQSVDLAGNVAVDSGSITVDTIAPIDPTVELDSGSDSGSQGDWITNSSSVVLNGTSESGTRVTVKVGSTVHTVTPDQHGNWSLDLGAYPEGEYSVEVVSTDTAGNTSSASETLVVDRSMELTGGLDSASDTGVSPTDGITNNPKPTFSGKTDPSANIAVTITLEGGGTVVLNAIANEQGVWEIDSSAYAMDLPDGDHSYEVEAIDAAGNSSSFTDNLSIDTLISVTVGLDASTNSGSKGDDITNDSTPRFSGVGQAGDAVEVRVYDINGVLAQTMTATVGPTGSWYVDIPNALADGDYTVEATATDAAGNSVTQGTTVTVDTTDPTTLTGGLDDATNTGDKSDTVTKSTMPKFSGTVEQGCTVKLDFGKGKIFDAVVYPDGTWDYQTGTPFADGTYNYTIIATDVAGNVTTEQRQITIDNTISFNAGLAVGSDTGWSDSDFHTGNSQPVFEGVTDPYSTVEITLNGNPPKIISTQADVDGNFSINLGDLYGVGGSLPDGTHNLSIAATDPAGNVHAYAQNITIDTSKPTNVTLGLDGTTDSGAQGDWVTNDSTPIIRGTSESGDVKLTVRIDGKSHNVSIQPDGTWTFAVPELVDGEYEVKVIAEDKAGNKTTKTETLVIDTQAPVGITGGLADFDDRGPSKSDGITSKNSSLTFKGSAEPDATVSIKISGVTYPCSVDANGDWSVLVPTTFSDGTYTVEIHVTDLAGNSNNSETFDFTIDTVAPQITGIKLADADDTGDKGDNTTNKTTPSIEGVTSTDAARVWITIDGTSKSFDATLSADGSWSCQLSGLGEGTHTYTVHSIDVAGNESTADSNVITIDTTNNVEGGLTDDSDTGRDKTDNITSDNKPRIEGTTDLGNNVTLKILNASKQQVYTDQVVNSDGTFRFDVSMVLPDGVYTYEIIAVDKAGNEVIDSAEFTVDTISTVSVRLDPSSDTGQANDGLTNHKNPKVSGKAEPNSELTISVTGVLGGSHKTETYKASANNNGDWIFTIPDDVKDGSYTVDVTATDVAGNISNVESTTFDVDRTPPSVTGEVRTDSGSSSTDNITKGVASGSQQGHLDFIGTSSGGAIKIAISIGGKSYDVVPEADGSWEFVIPTKLSDNKYAYTITSVDAAGNVSAPVKGNVTLDTRIDGSANLHESSDSGVKDDDLTNNPNPVISGSGEAGLTVSAKISGNGLTNVDLGTVTADQDGNWQFDLSALLNAPLVDGAYDIVFTGTDLAGNSDTFNYKFEVDTQPPAITLNKYNGGEVTSGKPEISGTGEAGSTIYLVINYKVYTTKVGTNGSWEFPQAGLPSFPDGEINFYVYAQDSAGNRSENVSDALVINTGTYVEGGLDSGSDTGELDSDGYTQTRTPKFSGTGEAGGDIDVKVFSANGQVIGTYSTTVGIDGLWEVTVPSSNALSDGVYSYTVTIDDKAGNVVTTERSDLIVDNTVAVSSIRAWSSSYGGKLIGDTWYVTDRGGLYIKGTLANKEVGATIKVTVGGKEFVGVSDENGGFLVPLVLPDGTHTAVVEITDRAGNSTSSTVKFNIDDTVDFTFGCDDDLTGDAKDWVVSAARPTFSGDCDSDSPRAVRLELFGLNSYTIHGTIESGSWTIVPDFDLPDGTYSYRFVYQEESGRWVEHRGQIIVDTTNEIMSIQSLEQNHGADGEWESTKITGFAEPNAEVTVTINGVDYVTVVPSSGVWTIDVPIGANGEYTFNVTSVDIAGNVCALSNDPNNTIVVDFIKVLEVDAKDGEIVSPTAAQFAGKGDAGNSIKIVFTNDSGQKFTKYAAVNANGTWSVDISDLPDGNYTYKVTAGSDWDQKSTTGNIVVDGTPPSLEDLSLDSDTGVVGDKITNDDQPSISGKVSADADRIEVTFGGVTYVSGVDFALNPDGTFTFNVPVALDDGKYTYTVDVYDVAGNKSTQSDFVVIDTVGTTFNDLDIQGGSATQDGFVVNDGSPELSGKVDTDVVSLTVEAGGVVLKSGVDFFILPDGTWSLQLGVSLVDGTYPVNLTAVDAAGNTTNEIFNLEIDTQAPTGAGGLDPNENKVIDEDTNTIGVNQPVFTGVGEVGATVTVTLDGIAYTTVVDQGGSWRLEIDQPLSEGKHLYVIEVADAAGNSTQVDYDILFIDTTAPSEPLNVQSDDTAVLTEEAPMEMARFSLRAAPMPTESLETTIVVEAGVQVEGVVAVPDNTPSLSGVVSPSVTSMTLSIGDLKLTSGEDFFVMPDGSWEVVVPHSLPDGESGVVISLGDDAGNVVKQEVVVRVDTKAPEGSGGIDKELNQDYIEAGNQISNDCPVFSGTGEVGAKVSVEISGLSQTTVVGSDGHWSLELANPLSDGEHLYVIKMTDVVGNEAKIDFDTVKIDSSVAPDLGSGHLVLDGQITLEVVGSEVTFNGVGEFGDVVSIEFSDLGLSADATVGFDGSWEASVDLGSVEGSFSYSVSLTSSQGDVSHLDSGVVVVDSVSSDVVVADEAVVSGADTYVCGGADPMTYVTVSANGKSEVVTSDATGFWEATISGQPLEVSVTKVVGGSSVEITLESQVDLGSSSPTTDVSGGLAGGDYADTDMIHEDSIF